MRLILNGDDREVSASTVAELLEALGLGHQPAAVEVNGRVVPKRDHGEASLAEGDRVEVVTLVGGG
ncbi:sulfur carrier protein ThiS [Mucisphaera sp.]|uniref:sulfur carrier protein ThiS n=1 Tax=Mucisphaera sp. TaxID=2913024 RepID=UPI003D12BC9B